MITLSAPVRTMAAPLPESPARPVRNDVRGSRPAKGPGPLFRWRHIAPAVGLALLYIPSFWDLVHGLWSLDMNAHGPIVLAVGLWLLWFKSRQFPGDASPGTGRAALLGWVVLAFGLFLYAVGRSQAFVIFEIGSLVPVLVGLSLLLLGPTATRYLWFPFVFLLFVIPLPGSLVDAITQPMKLAVSWGAEHLMFALGYPIARSGVVLHVGQYQLLVADACAGLHSLFTLEALGLLYLNVMRHESPVRNAILAALIVPVSYGANLLRVIILVLVTYYFGDAAGQGFVHDFAGMVLFLSALLLIITGDAFARTVAMRWRGRVKAKLAD